MNHFKFNLLKCFEKSSRSLIKLIKSTWVSAGSKWLINQQTYFESNGIELLQISLQSCFGELRRGNGGFKEEGRCGAEQLLAEVWSFRQRGQSLPSRHRDILPDLVRFPRQLVGADLRAHFPVRRRLLPDDRRYSPHEQLQRSNDFVREPNGQDPRPLDPAGYGRCSDGFRGNRRICFQTAARQASLGCNARILGYVNEIPARLTWLRCCLPSGLSAVIFMGITAISGCSALFSNELKNFLKPLLTKSAHQVLAIATFVTAGIGICFTLGQQRFNKRHDPGSMRIHMIWILCSLLVLTLIGPLKTLYKNLKSGLSR